MRECLNCGYERQPKDDELGMVPPTECPKCGIIYDKITDSANKIPSGTGRVRNDEIDRATSRANNKVRPYIIGAFAIIGLFAGMHAWRYVKSLPVNGWYFNARGYDTAYKEHRKTAKPLLVYVYWDR